MIEWYLRRVMRFLSRIFRRAPDPLDDPHAYVGAPRKPHPSRGGAAVALDQPRYARTDARGGRIS
jgi:hypothetical protein